ncbi:MAG: XRE family transcriptional regulator [Thermomicrobiales bacterium]
MPTTLEDGIHSAKQIGASVRTRRLSVAMSVRALARLSGFSPSFISQVENGQASPSIASLEKIASALGMTLGSFFSSPDTAGQQHARIVRGQDGGHLTSDWSLATIRNLGQGAEHGTLESLLIELQVGGRSGHEPDPRGVETFAFVVEGRLQLHLIDGQQTLNVGDAVTLAPGLAHRWTNESNRSARLLMISSRQLLVAN